MHIVNLGVDLWVAGNIIKTLIDDDDYTFWGSGGADQQLVVGYQKFKQWARVHKWQCLSQKKHWSHSFFQMQYIWLKPLSPK